MLKMNFPFNILPDIVIGNGMYSKEAYESVCEQLDKGIMIVDSVTGEIVGKTTGFKDNQVSVEINDTNFGKAICIMGEDRMTISTCIEADAEFDEDGVQVAISAKIHYCVILPKSAIPELMATTKADVVLKEKTLNLEE